MTQESPKYFVKNLIGITGTRPNSEHCLFQPFQRQVRLRPGPMQTSVRPQSLLIPLLTVHLFHTHPYKVYKVLLVCRYSTPLCWILPIQIQAIKTILSATFSITHIKGNYVINMLVFLTEKHEWMFSTCFMSETAEWVLMMGERGSCTPKLILKI